jgi:hypothetical protein
MTAWGRRQRALRMSSTAAIRDGRRNERPDVDKSGEACAGPALMRPLYLCLAKGLIAGDQRRSKNC